MVVGVAQNAVKKRETKSLNFVDGVFARVIVAESQSPQDVNCAINVSSIIATSITNCETKPSLPTEEPCAFVVEKQKRFFCVSIISTMTALKTDDAVERRCTDDFAPLNGRQVFKFCVITAITLNTSQKETVRTNDSVNTFLPCGNAHGNSDICHQPLNGTPGGNWLTSHAPSSA